jgi:hypothetical protein
MQIYVIATFNDNNYVEKKDTHVDSAIYIILFFCTFAY